jgi:2-oxo-4-hydroxy-4-carboxy--5-ureidoimidazoline (OHCU) decarboxylase
LYEKGLASFSFKVTQKYSIHFLFPFIQQRTPKTRKDILNGKIY